MAERPYVNFSELKTRVPILDALKALGLAEQFKQTGKGLSGVCPLPSHKHGPMPNPEQFKIDQKDGVDVWHCFGDCQRGGDVIELVKAVAGLDNAHVRLWFAQHFADRLSLQKPKAEATARKGSGETAQPAAMTPVTPPAESVKPEPEPLKALRFHLNLDPAAPYLTKTRGLKPETIERFGLGLCKKGILQGYIAIPVHDYPGNNLVSYLGRWPGEDYDEANGKPKYKWPKGFTPSRVVYGLKDALTGTEGKPLIVVEGVFKALYLHQLGFSTAVSTFTASVSDEQADILASTGRPIILFFDGNEAGYKGMRTAAGKLIARSFVRAVKLPEGKEPDDLSADHLKRILIF